MVARLAHTIQNRQRMRLSYRKMAFASVLIIGTLWLVGCGAGGGHNSMDGMNSTPSTGGLNDGVFLDSPVEGLGYQTATVSGMTDEDGHFQYQDGETVTFFMGDMMLGETAGADVVTPIDMVPGAMDETHPTVTNMLRFMQTLDEDNDPANGITIPPYVSEEMQGRMMPFDLDPADFEHNADVVMFMDTLMNLDDAYMDRMMVSADDAQMHMRESMADMMDDHMGASLNDGFFLDSPVEGLGYQTATVSGMTDEDGHFQYQDGEIVTFFMGDMMLGETAGADVVTPIDMVPGAMDETHPTVTNMLRFMQTLDEDNDPANGITIPPYVSEEMQGRMMPFDLDPADFEHNADVVMFMDTLMNLDDAYMDRMMVPAEDAQTHMRDSMTDMEGDPNNGVGDQNDGMDTPNGGMGDQGDGMGDQNGGMGGRDGGMM